MIKFKNFDKLSVDGKRSKCLPLLKQMQKELRAKQGAIIRVERTFDRHGDVLTIYFSETEKLILKGWFANNIFITARRGFGL